MAVGLSTAIGVWATGGSIGPAVPERLPLLRIAIALVLFAGSVMVIARIASKTSERLGRRWWDPSDRKPEGPLSWEEIYTLVAFNPDRNPLMPVLSNRTGYLRANGCPQCLRSRWS